MNILVTGASGFVGKNLLSQLRNIRDGKAKNYAVGADITLYAYDLDSTAEELDAYCKDADFVFNLAGVNRPEDPAYRKECGSSRPYRSPLPSPPG